MSPIALLPFALAIAGLDVHIDRPPALTFEKTVDYVGWYSDRVRRDGRVDLGDLYRSIFDIRDANDDFGDPGQEVRTQLNNTDPVLWDVLDRPNLAIYLKFHESRLDAFAQATRLRGYWSPEQAIIPKKTLDQLASRYVSSEVPTMMLACAWERRPDQSKAVLDAHRNVLRFAEHLHSSGLQSPSLTGAGIRATVYDNLIAAVEWGVINDDDVVFAYDNLRRNDPGPPNWSLIIATEWAARLHELQYICPGGKRDIRRSEEMLMWREFDPNECRQKIETNCRALQELLCAPMIAGTYIKLQSYLNSLPDEIRENHFIKDTCSCIAMTYQLCLVIESKRNAAMLVLAIHQFHRTRGEWPVELDQLDSSLGLQDIESIKTDPLSGEPFHYLVVDGTPKLSSTGFANCGNFVYWPRQTGLVKN